MFEDHVVGLVGGAVEHSAEDDVVLLVRDQHQHVAGILVDVEIVVDAVAVAGHIIVRGHLLQLDGHVFDRAVDVGVVAGRLAVVLGGGLVEVDFVVAELLVALIGHRRGDAHGAVAQGRVVDVHIVDIQEQFVCLEVIQPSLAVAVYGDSALGVVIIVVVLCGMLDVPGHEDRFTQRVCAAKRGGEHIFSGKRCAFLEIVNAVAELYEGNLLVVPWESQRALARIIPALVRDVVVAGESLNAEEVFHGHIGDVQHLGVVMQYKGAKQVFQYVVLFLPIVGHVFIDRHSIAVAIGVVIV